MIYICWESAAGAQLDGCWADVGGPAGADPLTWQRQLHGPIPGPQRPPAARRHRAAGRQAGCKAAEWGYGP
jgi:hypothetical protein